MRDMSGSGLFVHCVAISWSCSLATLRTDLQTNKQMQQDEQDYNVQVHDSGTGCVNASVA